MSQSRSKRELRQAQRLSRVLGTVVFLMGVLAIVAYFVWAQGAAKPIRVEIAYLAANVLFSASVVAILLSKVTFEESNLSTRNTIEDTVENSLAPLRRALEEGSQADYRWHCVLSMPPSVDALKDYAIQKVSVEKTVDEVPSELRFVCIASYADDALKSYAEDSRYQLRWMVDEELDPNDSSIFSVLRVSVNGRELRAREVRGRRGDRAKQFGYSVPAGLRAVSGRKVVSYSVLLRKHVGRDARLLVRTQLFSTTFGADFRCVVAENMRTTGAWISGGEGVHAGTCAVNGEFRRLGAGIAGGLTRSL